MMENLRRFSIVLLLLGPSACNRVQPIYTVQNHAIPTASLGIKTEQVTQLITEAAQANGWLVEPVGPNEVCATQKWKEHSAVVLISHNDRVFSIRNDGSTNLLQQNDWIHKAYNERVRALESAIEKRLYQNQ
jgi:hypothetical protein